MKTQEQKEADSALEEAIAKCVSAYGLLDGATMVDFVGVVEGLTFDDDGEVDMEHYGLLFRNGNARSTVAIGVLTKGLDLLTNGSRVEED